VTKKQKRDECNNFHDRDSRVVIEGTNKTIVCYYTIDSASAVNSFSVIRLKILR